MLATLTTVRTTGINWESVAAIVALVSVLMSLMLWLISHRDRKLRQASEEIKVEITSAVDHLADVLMAKLETKETVARISERLARLEGAAASSVPPVG